MSDLPVIENAFLFIKNGKIADFGKMTNLELQTLNFELSIDATGKMVFPCFCDSHTHLVYPASREIEYVDKIKGFVL